MELGYNVMKGTECFVLLYAAVVVTEGYNVTVNRGISWNHRKFDAVDEMSYKPMSL